MPASTARNLHLVKPESPAVVTVQEQVDEIAQRIVAGAQTLDGGGRLRTVADLKAAQAAIGQALREVEALVHDWVQANGHIPPGHGSAVCEIDGQWFKATWKGGQSTRLPATQARALWRSVAERIADDYDLDDAGQRVLNNLIDQAGGMLTDDQTRQLARAVHAACALTAADARQHALDRVAAVYPVQTGSAGPRASVLRGDRWQINLDHYQEKGRSGTQRSFVDWNPSSVQPDTAEDQTP